MPFKVIDQKLWKNYIKICAKTSSLIGIEFNSEYVDGDSDKHIKTKIKSYGDKVNPSFQGKQVPKENASDKCFLFIMTDSLIRVRKMYYAQTLLEECNSEIKTNEIESACNDDLSLSSTDESHNESFNKSYNESDNEYDNMSLRNNFGKIQTVF